MAQDDVAQVRTTIHAPTKKVWHALTDPATIKQYMFGSDVVTDWKVGSPILYRGMWEGKPFEDKGRVLAVEPEKRLVVTHWSPLSGTPDTPDNYHTVTYALEPAGANTQVTITQDKNASPEEREHSTKNWQMVLDGMKKILEA